MDKKELMSELEKLYRECRIQERIITQMQICQLIEKIRGEKK